MRAASRERNTAARSDSRCALASSSFAVASESVSNWPFHASGTVLASSRMSVRSASAFKPE
jgi:hypothetical protein